MHEIRFIFLYHPAARYKVLVPEDPKQAAISGSRCFVIRVIYGVRFRLKRESLDDAGRGGKELDDIANDKNRIFGAASVPLSPQSRRCIWERPLDDVVAISIAATSKVSMPAVLLVFAAGGPLASKVPTFRMDARLRSDVSSSGRVNPLWRNSETNYGAGRNNTVTDKRFQVKRI